MTKLEEVGKVVSEFLKQTLKVKEARVIKASRDGEGWDTEAEVYEDSSFIKSLGLSTRVMDRNIYLVKLNENLEVASYERKGQQE